MERTIKKNLYALSDIMFIASFLIMLLCIIAKLDKKFVCLSIIIGIVGALVLLLQIAKGQSKITNKSNKQLFYKLEGPNTPEIIGAKSIIYNADGVKSNGKVYKICDGTHITVKENGEVYTNSLIGTFFNTFRGGYIEKGDVDNTFVPLFNAE
jgi:hypothetical protein